MRVSRAALRHRAMYDEPSLFPRGYASDMSKKYEIVRDKVPLPGGGFIEAVRMALIDLSCFGERHLDLTGYPHESEAAALASDWAALGVDLRAAAEKVMADGGAESSASRSTGRSEKAAAR